MLQLQDIVLNRGDRLLFDGLNLVIHAGQHVALIGRNGAGKSTLFDLLRRRLTPDEGDVRLPGRWRTAHMAQQAPDGDGTALDYVLDGHQALRKAEAQISRAREAGDDLAHANALQAYDDLGGYQAESTAARILTGLGFSQTEHCQPVGSFSGGWRVRLALARTLMTPADLMLLDEPTNHLDMEATLWLERWLAAFEGTLITIAHDRDFLDRATRYTAHLEAGRLTLYNGNYSSFETQYAARAQLAAAEAKKAAARAKELQAFVDRFRYKASKAKQAQSRLKMLERLGPTAVMQAAHTHYEFEFKGAERVSKPLIDLRDARLGYGSATVLDDVSLRLDPGARIGVIGVNGAGKSTLLKTLAGDLPVLGGDLTRGRYSEVGYFAQHQMEQLDDRHTPMAALNARYPEFSDARSRAWLGGWGFRGDDVHRAVRTFSGGERARLVLALIAAAQPAFLVLDEPTNHLDLDMRAALALALQTYPGAVLLVSHDRHLLRQCVDELWLVADGGVAAFPYDLAAYERGQLGGDAPPAVEPEVAAPAPAEAAAQASGAQASTVQSGTANSGTESGKARRQDRAARRSATRPLRQAIKRLEVEMEALSEELAALEARLADPATYEQDSAAVSDLLTEQGQLKARLEGVEQAWLKRQEELEDAERE